VEVEEEEEDRKKKIKNDQERDPLRIPKR